MKKILLPLIVISLIMNSCSPRKGVSGYYSYETSCLGSDLDGSQVLKAFGTGKTEVEAIENAKKRAIKDLLFKGIRSGKDDCQLRALIIEVNASEKYEDYFNNFFKNEGQYKEFTTISKKPILAKLFKGQKTGKLDVAYEVIVKVYMGNLKQHLKNNQIIN